MDKPLGQMTEEELGKLFPITLSDPDPQWVRHYQIEKEKIRNALGPDCIISIEHIGSTAIPGIKAKPSIDILVQITEATPDQHIIEQLQQAAYNFIPRPENPAPHMMFVKGYTKAGLKGQAFHIHVRHKGDWDEIYFRDYLIAHPEVARAYEELKINLVALFRNDREGYTGAKTDFVNRVTGNTKR